MLLEILRLFTIFLIITNSNQGASIKYENARGKSIFQISSKMPLKIVSNNSNFINLIIDKALHISSNKTIYSIVLNQIANSSYFVSDNQTETLTTLFNFLNRSYTEKDILILENVITHLEDAKKRFTTKIC